MITDRADAGRDSGVDAQRLRGRPIQHDEFRDDRSRSSDENREMNLSEHWMVRGIRPFTELGLLPTDRATSGREDRPFATSSIVNLRIDVLRRKNEKNANEPMHLIPMPSALLACRLLGRLGCQKQVGIGDRGRSLKIYDSNDSPF